MARGKLEDRILLEALKEPIWYYDLYARKKIASNKKVLDILKKLKDKELLEQHESEGGRGRVYYTLTLKGLVWIFKKLPPSKRDEVWDDIRRFLRDNKDKDWLSEELYYMIEDDYEDLFKSMFLLMPFDPRIDTVQDAILDWLINLFTGKLPVVIRNIRGIDYVYIISLDKDEMEELEKVHSSLMEYLKKRPILKGRLRERMLERMELFQRATEDMREIISLLAP